MSTVTSPVTQVAEVAVNSASSRPAEPLEPARETGSSSRVVPTMTAAAKPPTITWAGWVRRGRAHVVRLIDRGA